mmetsp:Transcript_6797/g.17388  ORF Transcript_6797/g.17388 Transcript_6797/m.17388 type:complete len:587 (-) Transcript_6797:22-1782(-)
MGFSTADLVSDEALINEFLCPICSQLVEVPVITTCSHVFCRNCYLEWVQQQQQDEQSSRCPKCATGLKSAGAYELQKANPLAWRLLCRVQVRCPLHAQGCAWKGDYGEVSSHLVNSDTHHSQQGTQAQPAAASNRDTAEALKQQGNQKFEIGAFREAIKLYSKAIALEPSVGAFYSNRAAAWLRVGAVDECITDSRRAIGLSPDHVKSHVRLCKALCAKGDVAAACRHIAEAAARMPDSEEVQRESARHVALQAAAEEGREAQERADWGAALRCYEALSEETGAQCFQLLVARSLVQQGLCDRAISITLRLIKGSEGNADAYAVRGQALLYNGDLDQSVKHLREALRLDPDHSDAQRVFKRAKVVADSSAKGKECVMQRQFGEAVQHFTRAIDAGELPPKSALMTNLHAERANGYLRLGEHALCLRDCDAALAAREDCRDAWVCRAAALVATGRSEEALREMTDLQRMFEHDTLVKHWKDKAQFEIRRAKRPDYYAVLGCSTVATEGEVKTAYKARAMEWHPDRHSGGDTGVSREDAEQRFKLVGEALEVLGDSHKRRLYDEGYDKEGLEDKIREGQRGHGHGHHH